MRYLWLIASVAVIWGLFSLGFEVGYNTGYLHCESQLDEGGD